MHVLGAVGLPLVPAIAWGLLDLLAAITFIVCLGLLWSWRRTVGAFLVWLGHKKISAHVKGFGFDITPFGFALTLDQRTQAYLGQAVAATEHAMVYTFHRMTGILYWTWQETSGAFTDVYNAIRSSAHATSTTVTKVVTTTSNALVRKLTVAVETLQHVTIPGIRSRLKALEHRAVKVVHATAGAIASPFPRIGRLEKTAKAQGKRLTKVEKALAAGVGVALLARTLAKMGLGWLRCRNVTKAGKQICGMDADLLTALLGSSLLLASGFSIREMAEALQKPTELIADGMSRIINEL